jgi:hypothetical protein
MSCGLTAITTTVAPEIASAFESVTGIWKRARSSAARASRRALATMSRSPELSRPEISASPIWPAPRIAIFAIAGV